MSNKRKRRVRDLAAKLNISHQAADNLLKARRRNGSAVAAPADSEDARGARQAEEHEVSVEKERAGDVS